MDDAPVPADATSTFTLGVWNAEWARAGFARGARVMAALDGMHADVVCLAEGEAALLGSDHVVTSGPDYGYRRIEGRRKTLLWSRWGWRDVDDLGHDDLPPGRYVAATTDTPLGPVRVMGVCVPWRDAHVRSGRRDRAAWEDHLRYLAALGPLLRRQRAEHPSVIVAGDINQRIPAHGQPRRVADALEQACAGLHWITASATCEGKRLIDHVAASPDIAGEVCSTVPNHDADGARRSDHAGVVVRLTRASATAGP